MSLSIGSNYFSRNYYNYSSSLFGNSNSGNSFNTGSLISDYYEVKSSSYRKLLKSYFAPKNTDKVKTPTTDKTTKIETTESQKQALNIANDATTLTSSIDKLAQTNFNTDSEKIISKNVQSFVDSYNKLMDSVSDSTNKTITQKSDWMAKQTKANSNLLSKVGITVNTDNSLSFSSDKIKNNTNTLSSLFGKYQSFAYGISYQSKQIYDVAAKESGSKLLSSSAYKSNGSYSPVSMSSMLDTLI